MCGIVGKLGTNLSVSDTEEVIRMRDAIKHRGPDDQGIYSSENCLLGHRRLSIIDLSKNGHQPMFSKDGKYVITFNGEVYNFKEIKKEFLNEFEFISETDTEVVLYSYIKFGEKALSLFSGMFAFAIWDTVNKTLFLARDRFGQKPLFYYSKPGLFYFASEIKAFEASKNLNLNVSFEGINHYLALGYILTPKTIYNDLYQLEPSTYMLVSFDGRLIKKNKYWHYEDYFKTKSNEKNEEKLNRIFTLLKESVKRRMISDVPLGAFLSGGIDSSIITYLLKKNHNTQDTFTFSIGFQSKKYDELIDANKVADYLKTCHTERTIKYEQYPEYFNRAVSGMDGLLADNSFIPMLAVADLASKNVKVVLTGDGGDEIFGGYITYKSDLIKNLSSFLPQYLLKIAASRKKTDRSKKIGNAFKLQQFAYGSQFDYKKAHYSWRLIFRPEERISILGEKYRELVYDTDPYLIFNQYYDKVFELDQLDQHFYVDAMTWMTDDILVKVDRSTMLYGIEARSPFLDKDLVEYAASLYPSDKLNLYNSKIILKDAFASKLPNYIFRKKKSGFNFPVSNFLNEIYTNEFQDYCYYLFKNKSVKL